MLLRLGVGSECLNMYMKWDLKTYEVCEHFMGLVLKGTFLFCFGILVANNIHMYEGKTYKKYLVAFIVRNFF